MMNRFFTLLLAASCLTAVGQMPDYVPTDGLVGWWNFDGQLCSESGDHCFDGFGDFEFVDLEGGGVALSFQGGYLEMPSNQAFNLSELTIVMRGFSEGKLELWKGNVSNPNDVNYNMRFGEESFFTFDLSPTCGAIINLDTEDNVIEAGLQVNEEWLLAAITRDEAGLVSVWTPSSANYYEGPTTVCTEDNPMRIGRWWNGDPTPSQGSIDYVGIWNRPLSQQEILQVLNTDQGCMDEESCNYNMNATIDDGSCYPCDIPASHCGQGTIWDAASQTCIPDNPSDLNYDGCVDVNDFMGHLAAFGSGCEEGVAETPWICGCPIEFHGYAYETVLIDGQCWFAENLKSDKYRNDDPIPTELTDGQWGSSVNGASAVYGEGVYGYGGSICYDYSPVGNSCDETWALSEFGRLYNWYAVNDLRGLCPYDWHVPSSLEWDLLLLNQGGGDIAMNKLKSINGWAGGGNGNNESGFKALPGGYRTGNGQFFGGAGETGVWWTSTQAGNEARNVRLTSQNDSFTETYSPNRGFSIRCLKD